MRHTEEQEQMEAEAGEIQPQSEERQECWQLLKAGFFTPEPLKGA